MSKRERERERERERVRETKRREKKNFFLKITLKPILNSAFS